MTLDMLDISGESSFQDLIAKYKKFGGSIGKVADEVAATVAAKGRTAATKEEEQLFHFGRRNIKSYKGQQVTSSSVYSSTLGGYKAVSNGARLMSFSFENIANKNKGIMKYARVKFTSRMANLFENDTKAYTHNSPFFKMGDGGFTFVPEGVRRTGKKFFYSRIFSAVQSSVPRAIESADKHLMERIRESNL